jgi:hypothetical protein
MKEGFLNNTAATVAAWGRISQRHGWANPDSTAIAETNGVEQRLGLPHKKTFHGKALNRLVLARRIAPLLSTAMAALSIVAPIVGFAEYRSLDAIR